MLVVSGSVSNDVSGGGSVYVYVCVQINIENFMWRYDVYLIGVFTNVRANNILVLLVRL